MEDWVSEKKQPQGQNILMESWEEVRPPAGLLCRILAPRHRAQPLESVVSWSKCSAACGHPGVQTRARRTCLRRCHCAVRPPRRAGTAWACSGYHPCSWCQVGHGAGAEIAYQTETGSFIYLSTYQVIMCTDGRTQGIMWEHRAGSIIVT